MLAKLGVVPQQIAGGDGPALERGTLDAAEFVGPYDDEKLDCPRSRSTMRPAGGRAARMLHLVVNLQKWNELLKHFQSILFQACEAANNWMLAKYDAVNAPALRRMVGAGELRTFTQPVMEAALKAANIPTSFAARCILHILGKSPSARPLAECTHAIRTREELRKVRRILMRRRR